MTPTAQVARTTDIAENMRIIIGHLLRERAGANAPGRGWFYAETGCAAKGAVEFVRSARPWISRSDLG